MNAKVEDDDSSESPPSMYGPYNVLPPALHPVILPTLLYPNAVPKSLKPDTRSPYEAVSQALTHEMTEAVIRAYDTGSIPMPSLEDLSACELLREGARYVATEQHTDAIRTLSKAIEKSQEGPNDNRGIMAEALHQLGYESWRIHDTVSAKKYFTEAADLKRELFGADHQTTLHALQHKGEVLFLERKFVEAETIFQGLKDTWKTKSPRDHQAMAIVHRYLGMTQFLVKKYPQAKSNLRRALDHLLISDKSTASEITLYEHWVGKAYTMLGLHEESEHFHQLASDLCQEMFDKPHQDTASSLFELALTQWRQDDFREAEVNFRACHEIRQQVHGVYHRLTLSCLYHIGMCQYYEEHYDNANATLAALRDIYLVHYKQDKSMISRITDQLEVIAEDKEYHLSMAARNHPARSRSVPREEEELPSMSLDPQDQETSGGL